MHTVEKILQAILHAHARASASPGGASDQGTRQDKVCLFQIEGKSRTTGGIYDV